MFLGGANQRLQGAWVAVGVEVIFCECEVNLVDVNGHKYESSGGWWCVAVVVGGLVVVVGVRVVEGGRLR